jgi:hypothetical protein
MGINTFPAPSSSGVNYSAGETGSKPGSPTTGATFYDTTLDLLQIYDGASWNAVNNSILAPTWTTASGSLGSVGAGNAFSFTVTATSVYGLTITYTSLDKPAWVTLNQSTGAVTGTAPAYTGTSDTYSFSISAYDGSNVAQRTFSITSLNTVTGRIYVAAGGGSGAAYADNPNVGVGGGGGGGLIEQAFNIPIGATIPITVGAGGAALSYISPANSGFGNKGSNSTFNTSIIAFGGGGGGNYGGGVNATFMGGGSGGGRGGGTNGAAGGLGVDGQGFAGGGTNHAEQYGGGGGGGAGGTGGISTNGSYGGGLGGAGGSAGNVAYSVQLCGGGGGSGQVTSGTGATNAGTGGRNGVAATSGAANRGGGGGAAYSVYNSGAGGSGVVIVRWLESDRGTATSTTGSPDYTTNGGYRYYTFNSSGSITL